MGWLTLKDENSKAFLLADSAIYLKSWQKK